MPLPSVVKLRAGVHAECDAGCLLAVERDHGWPDRVELEFELRRRERVTRDLAVHPGARLAHVGETNPVVEERPVLVRLEPLRCQLDLVEDRPEAIPATGLVSLLMRGLRAGSCPTEHHPQTGREHVGQLGSEVTTTTYSAWRLQPERSEGCW